MPPARRAVLHMRLTGRLMVSMLPAATQAQLAAAKALMAAGTLRVISRQATHRAREDTSPKGASIWDEDSEGSGS